MDSYEGTKARSNEYISENPGPIASDSLAAESSRSGGGFSENPDSAPYGVSGEASTFNNTDTSGATRLEPAPDADSRAAREAWQDSSDTSGPGGSRYPEGVGGQGSFSGTHSDQGYVGGPSSSSYSGGGSGDSGLTSATGFGDSVGSTGDSGNYGTGRRSSGGDGYGGGGDDYSGTSASPAPGYITSVVQEPTGGPKGSGLTEGGFEGEPKAGFAEPGSRNDPGRLGLEEAERRNAANAADVGARSEFGTGDNLYENVDREERA